MHGKITAKDSPFFANTVGGATVTIGTETANTISAVIQLTDYNGHDLGVRGAVRAYLSNDANGDSLLTTAHSSSPAIGTDGLLIPLVTDKVFELISEADGDIDITFTETGAHTSYLILIMPDGRLVASGAITFA